MSTSGSPPITRDLPTKYTFVALVIIATMSAVDFGIAALIITLMFLAVAVICNYLVSIVSRKKDQRDIYSSEYAARALLRFLFQAEFPISFVIYPHNGSQNPIRCRSCDVRCCRRISYAGTTNVVVALSAGASGIRQRWRNEQEPSPQPASVKNPAGPFSLSNLDAYSSFSTFIILVHDGLLRSWEARRRKTMKILRNMVFYCCYA